MIFRPHSPCVLDGDRDLLVVVPLLVHVGHDVRQRAVPAATRQEALSGTDPQEPARAVQEGFRALADQSEGD